MAENDEIGCAAFIFLQTLQSLCNIFWNMKCLKMPLFACWKMLTIFVSVCCKISLQKIKLLPTTTAYCVQARMYFNFRSIIIGSWISDASRTHADIFNIQHSILKDIFLIGAVHIGLWRNAWADFTFSHLQGSQKRKSSSGAILGFQY